MRWSPEIFLFYSIAFFFSACAKIEMPTQLADQDEVYSLNVKIFGGATAGMRAFVPQRGFNTNSAHKASKEPSGLTLATPRPCSGSLSFSEAIACCEGVRTSGVQSEGSNRSCLELATAYCEKENNRNQPMCVNGGTVDNFTITQEICEGTGRVWQATPPPGRCLFKWEVNFTTPPPEPSETPKPTPVMTALPPVPPTPSVTPMPYPTPGFLELFTSLGESYANWISSNVGYGGPATDIATAAVCKAAGFVANSSFVGTPKFTSACVAIITPLILNQCRNTPPSPVCSRNGDQLCWKYDGMPAWLEDNSCQTPAKEGVVRDLVQTLCEDAQQIATQCQNDTFAVFAPPYINPESVSHCDPKVKCPTGGQSAVTCEPN